MLQKPDLGERGRGSCATIAAMPRWEFVAPILPRQGISFGWLTEDFQFADGVKLRPGPSSALLDNEIIASMVVHQDAYDIRASAAALTVALDGVEMGISDPRLVDGFEKLRVANLALWLAKPNGTNFRIVAEHVADGTVGRVSRFEPIVPDQEHADVAVGPEDLERAKPIFASLHGLARDSAPWVARELLWKALTSRDTMRFVILWIGIESLFGPESGQEIRFRISHRLAMFLAPSRAEEGRRVFRTAKEGYDLRSKLVHGMRMPRRSSEELQRAALDSTMLMRNAFLRILERPELVQKFSGAGREQFLDELAFG